MGGIGDFFSNLFGGGKREEPQRAKPVQDVGNLTPEEAKMSASKRMFREGLYFTSPTGLSQGGTRGRSRLMGS